MEKEKIMKLAAILTAGVMANPNTKVNSHVSCGIAVETVKQFENIFELLLFKYEKKKVDSH